MACFSQHAGFSRDYRFGFYGCGWETEVIAVVQ